MTVLVTSRRHVSDHVTVWRHVSGYSLHGNVAVNLFFVAVNSCYLVM